MRLTGLRRSLHEQGTFRNPFVQQSGERHTGFAMISHRPMRHRDAIRPVRGNWLSITGVRTYEIEPGDYQFSCLHRRLTAQVGHDLSEQHALNLAVTDTNRKDLMAILDRDCSHEPLTHSAVLSTSPWFATVVAGHAHDDEFCSLTIECLKEQVGVHAGDPVFVPVVIEHRRPAEDGLDFLGDGQHELPLLPGKRERYRESSRYVTNRHNRMLPMRGCPT